MNEVGIDFFQLFFEHYMYEAKNGIYGVSSDVSSGSMYCKWNERQTLAFQLWHTNRLCQATASLWQGRTWAYNVNWNVQAGCCKLLKFQLLMSSWMTVGLNQGPKSSESEFSIARTKESGAVTDSHCLWFGHRKGCLAHTDQWVTLAFGMWALGDHKHGLIENSPLTYLWNMIFLENIVLQHPLWDDLPYWLVMDVIL